MRNYLSLVSISAKKHRIQNRLTLFCIAISVFLVTVIFGLADMEIRCQKRMEIDKNGEWHVMYSDLSKEEAACIGARADVKYSGWYDYTLEDQAYTIGDQPVTIYDFDDGMAGTVLNQEMVEGNYPQKENEVMITEGLARDLSLHTADTVTISLDGETVTDCKISGIFRENAAMSAGQEYIAVTNPVTYWNYFAKDNDPGDYLVMFKPYVNIRKAIVNIQDTLQLSDEQIQEHTILLTTMGQTMDQSMVMIYLTACGLFVLVMFAGIFMIAASINSSIERRTEFFGMLRCIGATREQIMRIVYREGILWCLKAIPLGVIPGVVVTSGICFMLKQLSPSYFAFMPVFECSILSIICGILLGFVTVIIASRAPAKKAAKVSPLAAVSGQANEYGRIGRKKIGKIHRIERHLGRHHAWSNKKNFVFMVCSFAFSIILFLSFSVLVHFMNHAVKPLRPWSPDLSVVDEGNSCRIPAEYVEQIKGLEGVDKAYGRMFSYDIPLQMGETKSQGNLISYEENQFGWAEKYLNEGSIQDAMTKENQVLLVFHKGMTLQVGDQITAELQGKSVQLQVAGILSSSPFDREDGEETLICSQDTFTKLTGENQYTIVDIQMSGRDGDALADTVRRLANTKLEDGTSFGFKDYRASNGEVRGAFYSFALFVYGFLVIIALITVVNIMNSMNISFTAHIRQYGEMRAVGMSNAQLLSMVFQEAVTYAGTGTIFGLAAGLYCNKVFYGLMVTYRWGDVWKIPYTSIIIIVLLVALGVLLSIIEPYQRIRDISIVDTIHAQ